jgi:hypothetical protein
VDGRDSGQIQRELGLPGTLLRLGDTAVVEITGLRNPCSQLDGIEPGLMAARCGPATRIRVELPAQPHRPLEPV